MAKRPTAQEVREHYRADVEALSTQDLLRMVRGDFEKGTPQYLAKPLRELATGIAQDRGIEFPLFTSYFTT